MDTLSKLGFDLANDSRIRLDLDDRPQKSPRACVIAADAPEVVHLITRAQGGLHDYQAFLHEAGPRAPLRGLRPEPLVHVPQPLARPRADRDLLVHPRGDLARARLALRVLRALGRGGAAERGGDDVPRGAALPALRGQARFRARLLGTLQRGRRHARRLLGEDQRRDRRLLPLGQLPRGHGRRLLLGRLPSRLDPLGAAARVPGARGRLRLVALEPTPATGCATCSAKARSRRARRSRRASASTRSTPSRSSPSFRLKLRGCLTSHSTGSTGTTS